MSLSEKVPICVDCGIGMTCERNGVVVLLTEELMTHADVFKCPACDHRVIDRLSHGKPYTPHGEYAQLFATEREMMRSLGGDVVIADLGRREVYGRAR